MGTAICHPLDHLLDRDLPTLSAVEAWLARHPPVPGLSWLAFADPDGAVGLVPGGPASEACPALLVMEQAGGYGVTICDPDDPGDLGPFATVEEALHGIGSWMAWAGYSAGAARAAAG